MSAVHDALNKVALDVPRSLYLEGIAGWDSRGGGVARLEGGAHLSAPLSLYTYGEWTSRLGSSAGIGARYEVDF